MTLIESACILWVINCIFVGALTLFIGFPAAAGGVAIVWLIGLLLVSTKSIYDERFNWGSERFGFIREVSNGLLGVVLLLVTVLALPLVAGVMMIYFWVENALGLTRSARR